MLVKPTLIVDPIKLFCFTNKEIFLLMFSLVILLAINNFFYIQQICKHNSKNQKMKKNVLWDRLLALKQIFTTEKR